MKTNWNNVSSEAAVVLAFLGVVFVWSLPWTLIPFVVGVATLLGICPVPPTVVGRCY